MGELYLLPGNNLNPDPNLSPLPEPTLVSYLYALEMRCVAKVYKCSHGQVPTHQHADIRNSRTDV